MLKGIIGSALKSVFEEVELLLSSALGRQCTLPFGCHCSIPSCLAASGSSRSRRMYKLNAFNCLFKKCGRPMLAIE